MSYRSVFICLLIITLFILLLCNRTMRGMFDTIEIFDDQPNSLGVYNLSDIEPVILKSAK
jgi:hypothetical protein